MKTKITLLKLFCFYETSDQLVRILSLTFMNVFVKQPLNIIKSRSNRSNLVAVNQEKRKLVGDTVYFATSGIIFEFLVNFKS